VVRPTFVNLDVRVTLDEEVGGNNMVTKIKDNGRGGEEASVTMTSGDEMRRLAMPAVSVSTPTTSASSSSESVKKSYLSLCRELNMDVATRESAWNCYEAIVQNYTLEGNQLHWLACALYVACHSATVPTVGQKSVIEGNGVSLTRLLHS